MTEEWARTDDVSPALVRSRSIRTVTPGNPLNLTPGASDIVLYVRVNGKSPISFEVMSLGPAPRVRPNHSRRIKLKPLPSSLLEHRLAAWVVGGAA